PISREPTQGQGTINSGRRIRPRREAPHSRRQTRRPLDQAGHRYWDVKGPPGWSEIVAAPQGQSFVAHAQASPTRLRERPAPRRPQRQSKAFASGLARIETRRPQRRLAFRVVATSPKRRPPTRPNGSLTSSTSRRAFSPF